MQLVGYTSFSLTNNKIPLISPTFQVSWIAVLGPYRAHFMMLRPNLGVKRCQATINQRLALNYARA